MSCCSLDHQLKRGTWSHIPEVLLPQDGARTAFNTKKLSRDIVKHKVKNTSLTFKYCILIPSMTRKKNFSPYPKLPQNISSRHSTQAQVETGEIQC